MGRRLLNRAALVAAVDAGEVEPGENWPKTVREHRTNVGALPCVITAYPYRTIHHCHGGTLSEHGWDSGGVARKQNEALIIPVKADFHCAGSEAIDGGVGVDTWEAWYGTQVQHLIEVGEAVGYSLFELAAYWEVNPPKRG